MVLNCFSDPRLRGIRCSTALQILLNFDDFTVSYPLAKMQTFLCTQVESYSHFSWVGWIWFAMSYNHGLGNAKSTGIAYR